VTSRHKPHATAGVSEAPLLFKPGTNCHVRRCALLLLAVSASLFFAGAVSGAVKDNSADVRVLPAGANQFAIEVQNTGDLVMNGFTFAPGPGLSVASVVSASSGSCVMTGPTFVCTGLSLNPPLCGCQPGQILTVLITGSGEPAGSVTLISGSPVPVLPAPKTQNATVAAAPQPAKQTTVKKTAVKKKLVACKKGQHSTKKKPCRK
jgi:hypothetical protein